MRFKTRRKIQKAAAWAVISVPVWVILAPIIFLAGWESFFLGALIAFGISAFGILWAKCFEVVVK